MEFDINDNYQKHNFIDTLSELFYTEKEFKFY